MPTLAMDKAVVLLLPVLLGLSLLPGLAAAHHVLGRPAYALNEDSNTPPAMQAEIEIEGLLVNYMIYPAFPRPGNHARISLYIKEIESGAPFDGKVTFMIRAIPWFSWAGVEGHQNRLGVQPPDGVVFRQGFTTPENGEYLISARFQVDGKAYVVDFPMRVGEPPAVGPFGAAIAGFLLLLVVVAVARRRQSITAKIRASRPGRA